MTPGGVDGGDDRGKAKAGTQTATAVQGLGWDWMGLGGRQGLVSSHLMRQPCFLFPSSLGKLALGARLHIGREPHPNKTQLCNCVSCARF